MIEQTRPSLPPIAEFQELVQEIWDRRWLTNSGPLVNRLELLLKDYLNVEHLLYVANGTLALQLALRALNLRGEVITTPFTYVATPAAAAWESLQVRMVDIDRETLNISPAAIKAAITKDTKAILAVHVYGNPCDVQAIEAIAEEHKLRVVYDAAHAFGVRLSGRSILGFGDASCLSFHATKVFHTVEGGAIVCRDPELLRRIALMRNFGHDGPGRFTGLGINAKNSELHAAMGICNLRHIDEVIARRQRLVSRYNDWLGKSPLARPVFQESVDWNCAYYAVIFPSEDLLIAAVAELEGHHIHTRRYFHPALNVLGYVSAGELPNAADIASRVLCLPLYDQLTLEEVDMVCRLVLRILRYS